MKKALLAALFVIIAASWCLAQTDSVQVPVNNSPCQSAPCADSCQPGVCAMTCQPGACAKPFVPKWAVGTEVWNLHDLPGTVTLERLFAQSSIEYFLSAKYNGSISSDGTYLEDKDDRANVELGANYKRLLIRINDMVKLMWGVTPELYYRRTYSKSYMGNSYVISDNSYYGMYLCAFVQASAAKDFTVKNITLRHEIRFTPASAYGDISHVDSYHNNYYGTIDTTITTIEAKYGINAITKGSLSYSIKYLF
jgi:hypothetical protein